MAGKYTTLIYGAVAKFKKAAVFYGIVVVFTNLVGLKPLPLPNSTAFWEGQRF